MLDVEALFGAAVEHLELPRCGAGYIILPKQESVWLEGAASQRFSVFLNNCAPR